MIRHLFSVISDRFSLRNRIKYLAFTNNNSYTNDHIINDAIASIEILLFMIYNDE